MKSKITYRIAYVCLSDRTVRIQDAEQADVRFYLGGRGLGMLLPERTDDEMPLIFLTGPLTDFKVPPGGRYSLITRSADTGEPITLSSGSVWGLLMKRAGLDGIVFFHSAEACAGMTSVETTKKLRSVHGDDSTVLCIGPAGENLVPMFDILCNFVYSTASASFKEVLHYYDPRCNQRPAC